ncbi:MAG: acyltransferase [Burkholderiaceae bacterium]|nr:MAG: acyltransferase [Burkholderiaceae bacterium]
MAHLSRLFLKVFGWSFQSGNMPPCKCILIAAPHTSNWDFPMMLSYGFMLNLKYHWLGKHTLFFAPLGLFMRFLGGIPVNRGKKNDYVTSLSKEIKAKAQCILIIPPEGTRSRSDYWKSGFLHIARKAEVPIVFARLDYKTKNLTFSEAVLPSLLDDEIMYLAQVFYRNAKGLHPDNFGPVRLK